MQVCKCNSLVCTTAIRYSGSACHGPHKIYSGSGHNQFDSPRLVKHEAGFPNPWRVLIGSNQLWRINDSPYYVYWEYSINLSLTLSDNPWPYCQGSPPWQLLMTQSGTCICWAQSGTCICWAQSGTCICWAQSSQVWSHAVRVHHWIGWKCNRPLGTKGANVLNGARHSVHIQGWHCCGPMPMVYHLNLDPHLWWGGHSEFLGAGVMNSKSWVGGSSYFWKFRIHPRWCNTYMTSW